MEGKANPRALLGLSTAVLLVVAIELGMHADSLSIWSDETWSIFHSGKTVVQIVRERDLLWPFGYFLVLHGWMRIAGTTNDFVLHTLGVYWGLLAAAFLIRIGRIWRLPSAGLLAALAFGTSSYAVYFLLELRGYGLMLLLETSFICLYLLWLRQPSTRRSACLVVCMIAMLYTQFILGVVIAGATLHLVLSRPRRLPGWAILLGLAAIAFVPLAPQLWRGFGLASAAGEDGPLPSFFQHGLDSLYQAYSSHWDLCFAIVLACCAVGMYMGTRRLGWRTTGWLVAWGVGIPLGAYTVRAQFGFFTPRYLAFTIPPAVLLLGVGLAGFPKRWVGVGVLGIMALAPWRPFDFRPSYSDFPPFKDFMRTMAADFQPGDRLVVDPGLAKLTDSLEWSYYKSVYFPQGDFRLTETNPPEERRIWYLSRQGGEDPVTRLSVAGGRVQRSSWGPWYLHASLFEGPPDPIGTPFGEELRFLGADVERLSDVHAGDLVPVQLWWTTDVWLATNYSVTLEIDDLAGKLVAQLGGNLRTGDTLPPLVLSKPGEIIRYPLQIQIPYHLDDGMYTLQVAVTHRGDGDRLTPGTRSTEDNTVVIDRFHLASFATW